MGTPENLAAVKEALTRHPDGLAAERVAAIVGLPLRTARRYLLMLHKEGVAAREPSYVGKPPVFSWRYTVRR